MSRVATSVIRHDGKILLLKRSALVGSFAHHWAACSGYIEAGETAEETSRKEIVEEIGIPPERLRLMARGESLVVERAAGRWEVHPFLYHSDTDAVELNWEHEAFAWVRPAAVAGYDTVPRLPELVAELLRRAEG